MLVGIHQDGCFRPSISEYCDCEICQLAQIRLNAWNSSPGAFQPHCYHLVAKNHTETAERGGYPLSLSAERNPTTITAADADFIDKGAVENSLYALLSPFEIPLSFPRDLDSVREARAHTLQTSLSESLQFNKFALLGI